MSVNLSKRHQQVLWATIQHYIATAEPVASKTLVEEYDLSVSPATIRNAFALLEKAGLLYQPHPSAGRIPSDSGYRVYVDRLLQPSTAYKRKVEKLLAEQLNWDEWSTEAVLHGAAQILSTLSGCIALVTMPHASTICLRHLQLVQLDPKQVILVLVTDAYETQSAVVDLPISETDTLPDPEILDRELQILSNFLNNKLRGRPLKELPALDWSELDREFARYADWLKHFLRDLSRRLQAPPIARILVSGVAEVLRQPEFSELEQVKGILQLLEADRDSLLPLIFVQAGEEGQEKRAHIRIGSENPLQPIRNCTLMSAVYCRGSIPVGSVGFLGPTRMRYDEAIATVEAAAGYLTAAMS